MYRLFIVEDDPGIANAVAAQAQAWNLQTHIVQDFSNVMHEFAEFSPHIVLLDIMLPFFDGYHWCSEIRRVSKVPAVRRCPTRSVTWVQKRTTPSSFSALSRMTGGPGRPSASILSEDAICDSARCAARGCAPDRWSGPIRHKRGRRLL